MQQMNREFEGDSQLDDQLSREHEAIENQTREIVS